MSIGTVFLIVSADVYHPSPSLPTPSCPCQGGHENDYYWVIFGSFWVIFRTFSGDDFGVILASFLVHFRFIVIILGSSLGHFGVILGSFWDPLGIILESCWYHFEPKILTKIQSKINAFFAKKSVVNLSKNDLISGGQGGSNKPAFRSLDPCWGQPGRPGDPRVPQGGPRHPPESQILQNWSPKQLKITEK